MTKQRGFSESSVSSLQVYMESDSERHYDDQSDNHEENTHFRKLVRLLLPKSKFRLGWEAFIFVAIWYNSIMTPIRLFIFDVRSTPLMLIYIDIGLDVIFVIDTILQFYRPHLDKDTGRIVTNLQEIRAKYTSSGTFYLNIIACIPLLKGPISPLFDEETNLVLSTNFNVLRMIRVFHFPSQFQEFKMFLSQKSPVNESIFRMIVILFFTQLLMCILGPVYFGLAAFSVDDVCPDAENFAQDILETEMWIAKDSVIMNVMDSNVCDVEQQCNECPQHLFFARSVYFLMQTLFTIGYGDSVVPSRSNLELTLVCIFMLFGVFGYGLIIANMTSVLSNIDVVNMRFRHEMDSINKWMVLRSVPETLKQKVELHFSYLVRTQHGMLDDTLFSDLPPQLRKDFDDLAINLLMKIPFFQPQYRNMLFLSRTANALIRRIYPPGSVLLYEGEKQRELIIIKLGRVNMHVRGSEDPVGTLVAGDFIGDYQLLFGTVNQVGVTSPEFSETLVLTFHRFEELMDQDVEFRCQGGNFRQSSDPGALETIDNSKKFLEKIAKNIKSLSKKGKSRKLQSMLKQNEASTSGFCILPTNRINVLWDIFALISIMYYAVSSPLRFAMYFRSKNLKHAHDNLFFIDYAIDLLYIIDFILRLQFYAFVDLKNGRNELIVERDLIRKNYTQSEWYRIDRIAIIPFDILSLPFRHHTIMRIPKLARMLQIPHVVKRLQRNLDECMNVSLTESQGSGLMMLIYSILIIVWSSSGWNALRNEESLYKSVYWALTTLTTVGYGDLTPSDFRETCYAIVIGAIGATFTAGIIANVTSFFHDVDISQDNIDHKLNCVQRFMENHACTLEQSKRIQEYFDYIEREQEGLNEALLLEKSLPDHLRKSLLVHVTHSMVINCNLFVGCESGFLRQVMTTLEQRFYGSRSMVLNSTMPADGMYFIKKGALELVRPDDFKTLKRLEADDNFAEGCLFEHWHKNPYLAISITDCELWFLSRWKFNRLVDDFPRVRALMGTVINSKDVKKRRKSVQYIAKAVERAKRKKTLYIHPDGYFIQCWFGLVLVMTLYHVIVIPFRVSFMENHDLTAIWLVLDYSGDIILVFDIIIRALFLAYYDDNHLRVTRSEIWSHYLQSGKMKWHMVSIIPFEVAIIMAKSSFCPLWKLQSWSLFRMNKVLRFVEMGYLINRVETTLAKAGVRVPKNAIRVGKLFMVILLSAHVVACIFFIIANMNQHYTIGGPSNWTYDEGLVEINPVCPGTAASFDIVGDRYLTAMYWAMATLTTVGYGDVTPNEDSLLEIVFATVILIIGTAIYTMVIALLEDIVSQLDVTSSLHKMRTDKVSKYISSQGLPENIVNKIEAYYEVLWKVQCGVKGKQLFAFFPGSFRTEITLDMISTLLQNTFFIKDCTADFIAHLLEFISIELFLPGDTVFHEGEKCNSLLFLFKGDIDLLTSKNVKFKSVSNCVLGEASFFGLEPHLCTAKATNQCEVFVLDNEDFIACLHENQLMQKYVDYLLKSKHQLEMSKESISKMIKNLKSSKMEKMLVTNEEDSLPRGIILPGAMIREIWDAVALIFTIVFTYNIPYQISFSNENVTVSRFCVDLFMDLFFVLDAYARMMNFAVVKDGTLITNPRQFRKLYINGEFRGDLISITPLSTVIFFGNLKDQRYGISRLLQLTRVRRFGTYLETFFEALRVRYKLTISTAVKRILQIFFIVLFLSHWFACTYHFIGFSSKAQTTWLVVDESLRETMISRYIRSFFWSLYTVTTIGYGSIPVVTNLERIFAMFVMVTGAVICDAGITAILTSIISIRDQQQGNNNRRIQCCKRFMKTNIISESLQERVLSFYNYNDVQLENIDEAEILADFPINIRNEILHFFCFEPLKESYLLHNHSNGAVRSLVQLMNPYLAIPRERLSVPKEPCNTIFILRSGLMKSIDSTGYEMALPSGSIIGHSATAALSQKYGDPEKVLSISLKSAQGLKGKVGHPYVIFKVGPYKCRSAVKKTKDWVENILMKLPQNIEHCLSITVKAWEKGQTHSTIGSTNVVFNEEMSGEQKIVVRDGQCKSVGSLILELQWRLMHPHEILESDELTTVAKGYCHLYSIERIKYEQLRQYFDCSSNKLLEDRLIGPFLEHLHEGLERRFSHKERIKKCWRRPSRPSYLAGMETIKKKSLVIERNSVDQNDVKREDGTNKPLSHSREDEIKESDNHIRGLRNFSRKYRISNSIPVHPEETDEEVGIQKGVENKRQSWMSSNEIKTGTLTSQGKLEVERSEEELSQILEEISERDESWDVLVKLNDEEDRLTSSRRRGTFLLEWAPPIK